MSFAEDRARLEYAIENRKWELIRVFTGFSESDKIFRGETPSHAPCPVCQGTDTFRVVKNNGEVIGYFCGRGGGRGDFKGLLAHLSMKSYAEICGELREHLFDKKEPTKQDKAVWALNKKRREQQAIQDKINDRKMKIVVSEKADRLINSFPVVGFSRYIERKNVNVYKGVRFTSTGIAIPMMGISGKTWGIQFIDDQKKTKRFLKKQLRNGVFFVIGKVLKGRPILFAEGYATGATVHSVTGFPVVVCFASNNVINVIKQWRKLVKDRYQFINIADNDHVKHRLSVEAGGVIVENAGGELIKEVDKLGIPSVQAVHYSDDRIIDFNDVDVFFDRDECEHQLSKINEL